MEGIQEKLENTKLEGTTASDLIRKLKVIIKEILELFDERILSFIELNTALKKFNIDLSVGTFQMTCNKITQRFKTISEKIRELEQELT